MSGLSRGYEQVTVGRDIPRRVFLAGFRAADSFHAAMNLFRKASDAQFFAAGSEIFRQGETGDKMYAMVEGEVEIVLNGVALETIGPGEVFGEMALVEKSPRSATARTKTDCLIVVIDERRFLFLVQQTPFFAIEVMRTIAGRLRRLMAARGN